MASYEEQETIINYIPTEKRVNVYTAYPPHIRKIRNDSRFTIVREFTDSEGNVEAIDAYTLRTSHLNVLIAAQREPKQMSEEQRKAASERMKRLHAK